MSEQIYKTMKRAGAGNIAVGIVIMVTGITAGILLIIQGAALLNQKKNVLF